MAAKPKLTPEQWSLDHWDMRTGRNFDARAAKALQVKITGICALAGTQ